MITFLFKIKMNYLDLLTEDLIEKILNTITDDIDNKITILHKKYNKLNEILKYLNIEKCDYDDENFDIGYIRNGDYHIREYPHHIRYDNIVYSIRKYLFSNFESKKDIVLFNLYDEDIAEDDGDTFISHIIKNPTYFDILIEANKSVIIREDYSHIWLEGLNHIPNSKIFEYLGIRPNENINYYELCFGS